MQKMICMVGLPKSGKSTYVDSFLKNTYQIICADDIRLALGSAFNVGTEPFVWAIHNAMIEAYMFRRFDICLDSTNTKEERLDKYHFLAKKYDYDFKLIVMDTPKNVCLSRCDNNVLRNVIERMNLQFNELQETDFYKNCNKKMVKYDF